MWIPEARRLVFEEEREINLLPFVMDFLQLDYIIAYSLTIHVL